MGIISCDEYNYKLKAICSQMILNFIYKCTNAIILFNKETVIEEFKIFNKEIEREIDKIVIRNNDIESNYLDSLKICLKNFSSILNILTVNEW